MICYECAADARREDAVAICAACGAGMCLEHRARAERWSNGGTQLGCAHRAPRERATPTSTVKPKRRLRAA